MLIRAIYLFSSFLASQLGNRPYISRVCFIYVQMLCSTCENRLKDNACSLRPIIASGLVTGHMSPKIQNAWMRTMGIAAEEVQTAKVIRMKGSKQCIGHQMVHDAMC